MAAQSFEKALGSSHLAAIRLVVLAGARILAGERLDMSQIVFVRSSRQDDLGACRKNDCFPTPAHAPVPAPEKVSRVFAQVRERNRERERERERERADKDKFPDRLLEHVNELE